MLANSSGGNLTGSREKTVYLPLTSGHRPSLSSHSESIQLVPKCTECWPILSCPNSWSSLKLTWCCHVSASVLPSPLIASEQLHKFRTPRLETQVQHTSWSWSPTMTEPHSQSSRSWQSLFREFLPLPSLGWEKEEIPSLTDGKYILDICGLIQGPKSEVDLREEDERVRCRSWEDK